MRIILVILCCLSYCVSDAQNLTGIWRGHFKSGSGSKLEDSLGIYDMYKFETQIEQNAKEFKGVTYSYRTTEFYGKAECYGAVNPKTRKVLLEENRLVEVHSISGGACLMTLFLEYSKVGKEEFLEGTFTAMDVKDSTFCPGGTVFLRKVPNSDFYKEPFLVEREKNKPAPPQLKTTLPPAKTSPPVAKNTPPAKKPVTTPKPNVQPKKKPAATASKPPASKPIAKSSRKVPERKTDVLKQLTTADTFEKVSPRTNFGVPVPRVIETRENELVKTISTTANDVYIKIYDNGTIDNDTVSVYVDNKLVISKQRLTEKPITLKISLDQKTSFHELVMVAENLGEIPPNTSLMVVNAGDKQYEVRITSTEQKNAMIHFKKE